MGTGVTGALGPRLAGSVPEGYTAPDCCGSSPGYAARKKQSRGLLCVTRSPKLGLPPNVPRGQTWNYMLNFPFQVAPRLAATACNIKPSFGPGQDFENGVDIVLFSDRLHVDTTRAIPVTRNQEATNPNAGGKPCTLVKYPCPIGFVPLGAKRKDGSAHPHAGTGFGLTHAAAWPKDGSKSFHSATRRGITMFERNEFYSFWELHQFAYDGREFRVVKSEPVQFHDLLPGWVISFGGMTSAIPDGDDMLLPISGGQEGMASGAGVLRWSFKSGMWRPVSFDLVTGADGAAHTPELIESGHGNIREGAIEASLIRDIDGEFLLGARGRRTTGHPVRVWKSSEHGQRWKLVLFAGGISSSPVTLNQAADGTPYIAANRYQYESRVHGVSSIPYFVGADGRPRPDGGTRETLMLWPLNDARDSLEIPLYGRDCLAEFGPPPHDSVWSVDHATSYTVQLGDGKWHNLLGYRVLEHAENTFFVAPTPFTGSYLEEVVSAGPARPTWNF